MKKQIEIILNGRLQTVESGLTVTDLVRSWGADRGPVAVEVNEDVVARGRWQECRLQSGDRVEIVHFVGGG